LKKEIIIYENLVCTTDGPVWPILTKRGNGAINRVKRYRVKKCIINNQGLIIQSSIDYAGFWRYWVKGAFTSPILQRKSITSVHYTEAVFLNVYGAQESIPRKRFRQSMQPGGAP
jgi:hypothetical protein